MCAVTMYLDQFLMMSGLTKTDSFLDSILAGIAYVVYLLNKTNSSGVCNSSMF